jgi:hypothetical protein
MKSDDRSVWVADAPPEADVPAGDNQGRDSVSANFPCTATTITPFGTSPKPCG